MTVYVIAEFGTSEAESITAFRKIAPPRSGRFGEKVLIETDDCETLAGEWTPQRLAVLEFPTIKDARAWWSAAEDRLRPAQMALVKRNMILVKGVE